MDDNASDDMSKILQEIDEFQNFLKNLTDGSFPVELIRNRDYAAVERKLADSPDKNNYVDLPHASMTGLEYSVNQVDWKMFLVFLLGGTDPAANMFDGVIENFGSLSGYGVPDVFEGFRSETSGELEPVPGFEGLNLTLNMVAGNESIERENYDKMRRVLWLAECRQKPSLLTVENIPNIKEKCLLLKLDFDWNERFAEQLIPSLTAVRQLSRALPEISFDRIKKDVISSQLASTILSLFEDIVEEAKSMQD